MRMRSRQEEGTGLVRRRVEGRFSLEMMRMLRECQVSHRLRREAECQMRVGSEE